MQQKRKVYIGMTSIGVEKRFSQHMNVKDHHKPTSKIQRAVRKYGKSAFRVEEIYCAFDKEHCGQIEDHFITEYDSINSGYNTAKGGQGGCIVLYPENPEYSDIVSKISKSLKGNEKLIEACKRNHALGVIGMHGKKHSEETKAKMSASNAGRTKSEEAIAKHKASLARTYNDPNYVHPLKGRPKDNSKTAAKLKAAGFYDGASNPRAIKLKYNGEVFDMMRDFRSKYKKFSTEDIQLMIADGIIEKL